jgi:hypothetical protein
MLVMRPKFALVMSTFGLPSLMTLKTLNASTRSCSCLERPSGTFFCSDRSTFQKLGARSKLRGELPNALTGAAKAAVLNHLSGVGSSRFGSPTRSARA